MTSSNASAPPDELDRWRALPKVELHLHLDTSVSYVVASQLEAGLTHERYLEEFQAPPQVGSLSEFLRRALRQVGLLQTEVTFDLAGDEIAFPLDAQLSAFSYAREQGLPFTVMPVSQAAGERPRGPGPAQPDPNRARRSEHRGAGTCRPTRRSIGAPGDLSELRCADRDRGFLRRASDR